MVDSSIKRVIIREEHEKHNRAEVATSDGDSSPKNTSKNELEIAKVLLIAAGTGFSSVKFKK